MFEQWKDRWTLVTGASAGIGSAFAETLAAGGSHLVLTARRSERLEQLAAKLSAAHGVRIELCAADIGQPEGRANLWEFTQSRSISIDFLINNAGFGVYGEFGKESLERQLGMVQVNCAAVVDLTYRYLPGMVERRQGDILILASTAAFQGVSYMSIYAATKAFDLYFAEGLAQEVKKHGIRVCALCPGATESEFHEVAHSPFRTSGVKMQTAQEVVETGLRALLAGKHHVVSGWNNWMRAEVERFVPRQVVTTFAEKLFRPKV